MGVRPAASVCRMERCSGDKELSVVVMVCSRLRLVAFMVLSFARKIRKAIRDFPNILVEIVFSDHY